MPAPIVETIAPMPMTTMAAPMVDHLPDANDNYGCPHGGDHLPYDECRLLSTSDNHGNLCHGRWLFSTNDNHGWRLRAVANNFVSQLTMPQVDRSFDYEFWRFSSTRLFSAGDPCTSNRMLDHTLQ